VEDAEMSEAPTSDSLNEFDAGQLAQLVAGASDEQLEETILQTCPYAGVPRAVNAMKVLRELQEAAA